MIIAKQMRGRSPANSGALMIEIEAIKINENMKPKTSCGFEGIYMKIVKFIKMYW